MLNFCPDIKIQDIRGNVPTRIQKLRDGLYDAILLARAGVKRLNTDLSDLHEVEMDPIKFVPAPAQGVLALQIRESDTALFETLQKLNNPEVQECIGVERKILQLFQGGCQLPLGAYCEKSEEGFKLWASVAESWDSIPVNIFLEQNDTNGLAEAAVEQLSAKKKSLS